MRRFIPIAAVLVAFALPAATAQAAAPDQQVSTIDRTRTIPAGVSGCSFDILVHTTATLRVWTFDDGTQKVIFSDFHTEWSNPENGKTLTGVLGGPGIIVPNDDGTVTTTLDGMNGLFVVPGEGPIFADIGRTVFTAAADDPFTPLGESLFSAGLHLNVDDPFPAICEALA